MPPLKGAFAKQIRRGLPAAPAPSLTPQSRFACQLPLRGRLLPPPPGEVPAKQAEGAPPAEGIAAVTPFSLPFGQPAPPVGEPFPFRLASLDSSPSGGAFPRCQGGYHYSTTVLSRLRSMLTAVPCPTTERMLIPWPSLFKIRLQRKRPIPEAFLSVRPL